MIGDYGSSLPRSRPRTLVERIFARDSALWRLDWWVVLASSALCAIGAVLVWSATRAQLANGGADPQYYLKKQLINIAVGLVFALVVGRFDYRRLRPFAPLIYGICCFALLVVLTPVGVEINGAKSWLGLPGGFQFQPAELAKLGVLLMLGMLLGERHGEQTNPRDRTVLLALVLALVPMGLIMLQPDLGSALVFAVLVFGMIVVSGAKRRWIVGLIAAVVAAIAGVVHFGLLKPYQVARFTAFADLAHAPEGVGYSARQARMAIGSGGLFGKGLFDGSLTNGQYVPEQQSDFIFTVAGEEFGFVGSALIVVLLGLLLWRGLRIAARADDPFGSLIASGVVCWFGFQTFENIGMTLGLMPVTGLPLPLVSYGGSSMFATLIGVGLLVNVHLSTTRRSRTSPLRLP